MGEHRLKAFELVESLRAEGWKADMDHCSRSLKAQFKYANETGAPFSATIGDDEAKNGTVILKNMVTREERTVPVREAGKTLAEMRKEEQ